MLNWKNVRLIFLREVRDQLRDRRTLFMVAVLPLLLYPALGIGMVQLTVLFSEQPRNVVVIGADELPDPPLLADGQFVADWFSLKQADADKLEVISDAGPAASEEDPAAKGPRMLAAARAIQEQLAAKAAADAERKQAVERGDMQQAQMWDARAEELKRSIGTAFAASEMQVLVVVPEGLAENVARVSQQLADRSAEVDVQEYPRPVLVYNRADEKSMIAYSRVKAAFDSWEKAILQQRLKLAELPPTLSTPVRPRVENLALAEEISANVWSKMLPALLVIMSVTGAFYPAIDLGAGEKERGTMETLLISPARRGEIVLGKFFTVMSFSMATALLNLLSMGLTGQHMASMMGKGPMANADLSLPPPMALLWIVVLLLPLSAMFSALCLSLATFARSTKEGQYYLSPLLMVTLGLTVFCASPGVEISPFYSLLPIAGVSLLLKGLLLQPFSGALYAYAIPVLLATLGYSLLALWWAIEQFRREEVLFREAERFELGLWVRHLLRDKQPTPSFAEAGFCFVLIMLLQFAALNVLAQSSTGSDSASNAAGSLRAMMIQQIALIAAPALFMGILLTTSLRRTFQLRLPRLDLLCVSGLLACALHPLSLELAGSLGRWFFLPLPKHVTRVLQSLGDAQQPLWFVLLAFAVLPPICEELAFRGFILSGFKKSGRVWLAIVLSSLSFGVMHMIPQQAFNAALLGLVLGLIAVRSQSIVPCIFFHMVFNGLAICRERFLVDWHTAHPSAFLVEVDGQLRYAWITLAIAAILSALLLRYLVRQPVGTGRDPERPVAEHPRLTDHARFAAVPTASGPGVG